MIHSYYLLRRFLSKLHLYFAPLSVYFENLNLVLLAIVNLVIEDVQAHGLSLGEISGVDHFDREPTVPFVLRKLLQLEPD